MKQRARAAPHPRRLFGWIAGSVVAALVVTLAVVANGFDSREIPREDPTVWVERTAGQYARVNTETAEIDTIRVAESTSGVVQTGDLGLLLTQGFGRAHTINPASPTDVHDDGANAQQGEAQDPAIEAAAEDGTTASETAAQPVSGDGADGEDARGTTVMRTPDGTRQVLAAGGRILFFTQGGEAYLAHADPVQPGSAAMLSEPRLLDPFAEQRESSEGQAKDSGSDAAEEQQQYVANAAALDELGKVALYSNEEQSIRWFDASSGQWGGGSMPVPDGVPAEGVQLAILDGKWVLFDAASGNLWCEGSNEPMQVDISGVAWLQDSSAVGADVLIADEGGLWAVDDSGRATRTVTASGVAAQPRYVAGEAVAAWVGTSSAQMWTSKSGEVALDLDPAVEDLSNAEPEIRTNSSRALIAERRSGMMWTVPDGKLIPVEQWNLVDPPKEDSGTVVTQDVTEQEPPVAIDDAFGVRAGEPVLLSVLLNDYDPNRKDVLTVVGEGLGEGLSEDFGTVTQLSDGQGTVLYPSPSAQGTASFSYRITDGVNVSQPATVTLTVIPEDTNAAPQWCAVEGCQRTWPSPEVAPGGTLVLPILEAWVDPDGDPLMLARATVASSEDPLRALITADGRLAVRHLDPNAPDGDFVVKLVVRDSWGAETERDLRVRVRTGAGIEFASAATTAKVDEPSALRPLERVSGGSGAFELVDATVQQGAMTAVANPGTGTVEVVASAQGNAIVQVTVRDTATEQEATGVIRVTAVGERAPFAVPPLRAFVRALADSTVDVLSAVPSANSRALTVRSATVREGQLRADVIEHSSVRVSGSTLDGQPGRIGSVDVTIAEGELASQGRMTVFQVGDTGAGAIAVTDTATVRASSVVDIPVLDNDVAPPGERLVLHPEIKAPGAAGELAFASGSRVRYLAPSEPGVYTLSYTTYGASSPEQRDTGQVRVTVLATGSNRDPQPATVTVRVAPGEMVKTTIPLSGVDPDGDRLRLVSVEAPDDTQLSTSILPRSNAVQVSASASAQRSSQRVNYTVRDSFGGEAQGSLRVIVTEPDSGGGAPVVYSDYVRIARGSSEFVTVRPLENDLDPSGGTLQLAAVEPNVPGGESSPEYAALMNRLDLSGMKQGIVRVMGGDDLGTVSFKYLVKSSKTKSTADGLIVVQVSERIGQQAPAVTDTVLSVRDRADFERTGVDVVTDRVRWASGDTSSLKLSLWGSAESRYTVKGSSILGSYKAEGDLVPFRLAGTDMTGAEVETFGFLIVPPLDELRLSLKPGAAAISVAENKSVDVDIVGMLDLGQGDRVELDQATFTTQRQQASCAAVGATTIRYSAGKEAPWADSCAIRVRLTDQTTYTMLPLAVGIMPDEPAVQLNPVTRTVAPGAAETINLLDMVQWQGGREGNADMLRWSVGGGSSSFEVTISGAQAQVRVRADAVPGSQEVLAVSVSGSGESQSVLTLRVGEAAVDAPRGGTVSLQCTVGSSCSAPLTGISGEHDPFAGRAGGGLKLVSVESAGCQVGSLHAAGDSVSVAWADARGPGGQCKASFTVRDAQNRVGIGTIEFDALGVPRAPVGIVPTGANATSVTLTVSLSQQNSHPGVTGVEVWSDEGGALTSCVPSGSVAVCTVAAPIGKENGRQYHARAVNSVGPSLQTDNPSQATWAYEAPPAPSIDAEVVKDRRNTEQESGQVRLRLSSDRARSFLLSIDNGHSFEVAGHSIQTIKPGPHKFSVIAQDGSLPPGYSGSGDGAAATANVVVGAAPTVAEVTLQETGNNKDGAKLVAAVDENFAEPHTLELTYGMSRPDRASASCSSTSPDFDRLDKLHTYVGVICATSEFGTTTVTTKPVWIGGAPEALSVSRGYSIGGSATGQGNVREYTTVTTEPHTSALASNAWRRYLLSTGGVSDHSLGNVPFGATVRVQQCLSGNGAEYCSEPETVPPAGFPPTRITWSGVCVADGGDYAAVFTVEGRAKVDATFAKQGANGVRVTWSGFDSTDFGGVICAPAPDPDPDPEPPPAPGGG